MARLSQGDPAPDFTIEGVDGELRLSRLLMNASNGVILYFYPKASTPGCTTEACDFREARFHDHGYEVVGISPDSIPALEKFKGKYDLDFFLGSDPDHAVAEAYGAWGEKKNYGKVYEGLIRSTFVISPKGVIEEALYNVKATGHVARLATKIDF